MGKGIIRLLAFFSKEINEIRRQPKLVLSLILGPFLILLLFGAGYQGDQPLLKTELVVPASMIGTPVLEDMKQAIQANFEIVNVGSDQGAAIDRLRRGEVEVVEIIPDNIEQTVMDGKQAQVDFKYNEINPLTEQWITYLGYAQVTELNKTILRGQAEQASKESGTVNKELADARQQLEALKSGTESTSSKEVAESARRLNAALGTLALSPVLVVQAASEGSDSQVTQQRIDQLRGDLTEIEKAANNGTLDQQKARIETATQRISQLQRLTTQLEAVPPEVIVSPLQQAYENVYTSQLNFMFYYAPAVLALIVQHIAVTLGALSLVREKLLGAIEFYGVAPVWLTQVLVGKYMAYTLFIAVVLAVLIGLMLLLSIPFTGSILLFAGLSVVFILASLGVGFLISALSSTDSQAVQLSMLVLLLSIFFSGFFLPLENFTQYVRPVGLIIPLTYAIQSYQDIMLRGRIPNDFTWAALSAIAVITFALVMIIWRRQFRQIA